jgi:hypothetical protein
MDGAPKEIVIGQIREGLETFDDMKELEKHPGPYKVRAVTGNLNFIYFYP